MDAARAKVSKVNNFYESLPNGLCLTDGLSARQDNVNNCWNGKSRKRLVKICTEMMCGTSELFA